MRSTAAVRCSPSTTIRAGPRLGVCPFSDSWVNQPASRPSRRLSPSRVAVATRRPAATRTAATTTVGRRERSSRGQIIAGTRTTTAWGLTAIAIPISAGQPSQHTAGTCPQCSATAKATRAAAIITASLWPPPTRWRTTNGLSRPNHTDQAGSTPSRRPTCSSRSDGERQRDQGDEALSDHAPVRVVARAGGGRLADQHGQCRVRRALARPERIHPGGVADPRATRSDRRPRHHRRAGSSHRRHRRRRRR